jgi:hypothetical protein
MEFRGTIGNATAAGRIWYEALTALLRGFAGAEPLPKLSGL